MERRPKVRGRMNSESSPIVGILVLNYRHPEETLACVRSLLVKEGPGSRILWIENDAASQDGRAERILAASGLPWVPVDPERDPLPGPSVVGYIANPENLGYAGGNNVGLRYLVKHGIPYAWVLNNDTLLRAGSSRDLVAAAESRPEVGLWATTITSDVNPNYLGGLVQLKDFAIRYISDISLLEGDPHSYVSGCSMFLRTDLAESLGYIPDDYFLYYEDPAFSLEIRKRGLTLSAVPQVNVFHLENLSTGRRSLLTEYYCRRNRWTFIRRYFPEHFRKQAWRQFYVAQRLFFRLKFRRMRVEWLSVVDFLKERRGRTHRTFRN